MVYIYTRQSSTKEDRSISCEQQADNAVKFAESLGLNVDKIFTDTNMSGRLYVTQFKQLAQQDIVFQNWIKETKKTKLYRTGLSELFDKLKKNDVLIVDDLTRLYRPLTNSFLESAITQFLLEKEIVLYTVKNGRVNLNNFADELISAMHNRINSNQLRIQQKKCKDSLKRLKDSGELKQCLGCAIGYKYTGKKKEIEVDKSTAPIVKYVFENYLKGKSLLSMCREINKTWGRSIGVKSLKNILNRVEYTGFTYDSNNNLIKSKQTEGKELIDFNSYMTAKQLLDSRKNFKFQTKKYPNHFVSMVKCGKCGSTMNVLINEHGKYISFRCMSHTIKEKENCKISITANTLYPRGLSLEDALEPILILSLLKKLSNENNTSAKEKLEQSKIQLQNLLNGEQKLTEMFLNGLLDSSVYETNLKNQQEKKQAVQQEIILLENELKEDDTEKVRLMVNRIVGRKLTFEEYQELIPLTIKNIIVFEDKITVQTHFGDITLPRFKVRGILELYEYKWRNSGTEFKIYYYKDNFNIYKPQKQIFKYNNFQIFLQDEN